MKHFISFFTLVFYIFTSSISSQSPGDLDTTFGIGGIVKTDIVGYIDAAYDVAIQSDGKIILAGYSIESAATPREITLVRYLPDGNLDNTFGTDGILVSDISTADAEAYTIAMQTDGKIVVAGYSEVSGVNIENITVVRYNSDGTLDNTFGTNGVAITQISIANDIGYSVVIQTDGKIIVAGVTHQTSDIVLVRYNSDGSLDNSFGSGGIVLTDINSSVDFAKAVALQDDGKIVVTGHTGASAPGQTSIFVARYNSTGNLDATFGSNGIVITSIGTVDDDVFGQSVTIQQDGKIIIAGQSNATGSYHFTLVRYNNDGSLDNSFGANGVVVTTIGSNSNCNSIALDSYGYILAGGTSGTSFTVARYDSNGNLDPEFGSGGIAGGGGSQGYSIAIQPDDKILLAGEGSGVFSDFVVARYIGRPPEVNVISPNGGEDWVVGTTQQILWESENIENVKIEFTIDNGASWETIVDSIEAQTGVYEWIVPETISTQCRVKITDASDDSIFDVSDGTFTISSHKFTFVAQNTFLSDTVGSEMIFEINVQNISSQELTLYFKRTINDLPTNWISSLAFGINVFAPFIDSVVTIPSYGSSPLAPGESREWAVHVFALQNPGVANIRVVAGDFNNPGDSLSIDLVAAVSDTFLILYIPNGGENWQVGTNQSIVWNSSNVGLINIDYTTDNGSSWINIINDYDAGLGSYSWTIPNTPSSQCKVKLTDAANSNISDQSNSVFTIDSLPEPELSLIYPNGGEQFAPNDLVYIQWQHSLINVINLEFSDDNGATWSDIIMGFPADSNLYIWIIEPGISSTQCLIKICDFENPQFCDESDSVFTVTPPASITVLIPNGGEYWVIGNTYQVEWTSENIDFVKMFITTDNGSSWELFAENVNASDGSYDFVVPIITSDLCKIKIVDEPNDLIFDESDSVFTIDIFVSVEDYFGNDIPTEYNLFQNFPNPFNPSTTIYYSIPELSFVVLKVYDVLGNEISVLVNEEKPIGSYEVNLEANGLPSGIYFYKLQAGNFIETKKMVLMK